MSQHPVPEDRTLLIVEDDRPLRERLARAMEARGFTVAIAETVAQGGGPGQGSASCIRRGRSEAR